MIRVLGVVVLVGALAASCASSEVADEPVATESTTEPSVADPIERSVSAADEAPVLVAAAAEWQCDRQRFAFDSLADLDVLLGETLARHGVSAEDYAAFEVELESDLALREQVLAVYEADCLGG